MGSEKRSTGNVSPSTGADKVKPFPTSVLFKDPDDLRAVRIAAAANGMSQQEYITTTATTAAREFCEKAGIDLAQFEQGAAA